MLKISREDRKRIANLVRKALSYPNVMECEGLYLETLVTDTRDDGEDGSVYRACFWGLAFCGLFATADEAYKDRDANRHTEISTIKYFSKRVGGVSLEDAEKLELLHLTQYKAELIADKLERGEI